MWEADCPAEMGEDGEEVPVRSRKEDGGWASVGQWRERRVDSAGRIKEVC